MTEPLHAYLLAGGRGTRLRPLTDHTPKPLLPFLNHPIAAGWLRRLADAGIRHAHLLVGADPGPFSELAEQGRRLGLQVTVTAESSPLGSGGALRAAVALGRSPVLVVNADVATGTPLTDLLDYHAHSAADATILALHTHKPHGFGIVEISGTNVRRFVEKPDLAPSSAWLNGGIYVLEGHVIARISDSGPCDLEAEVFPDLADSGNLDAYRSRAGWADLGTPDRYLAAHRAGLDGRIRWPRPHCLRSLGPGIELHPTATVAADARLVPPVLVGAGARIGRGATVGPYVTVGVRARIGADVQLRNTVLLQRSVVTAGLALDGTIIGVEHIVATGSHAPTTGERRVTRGVAAAVDT